MVIYQVYYKNMNYEDYGNAVATFFDKKAAENFIIEETNKSNKNLENQLFFCSDYDIIELDVPTNIEQRNINLY